MRAPYQILAIPYCKVEDDLLFCVLHRADCDQWQFVAGGGEDGETVLQSAQREIFEEVGIKSDKIFQLTSMCYIPTNIFPDEYLKYWSPDTYIVPEYAFAFECNEDITLSHEHFEYQWLSYHDAYKKLYWDSNRTAIFELRCRLTGKRK